MGPKMRRVVFSRFNRSGNLLHIETDGCIINVRLGLYHNCVNATRVTAIEVLPSDGAVFVDGPGARAMNIRLTVPEED